MTSTPDAPLHFYRCDLWTPWGDHTFVAIMGRTEYRDTGDTVRGLLCHCGARVMPWHPPVQVSEQSVSGFQPLSWLDPDPEANH